MLSRQHYQRDLRPGCFGGQAAGSMNCETFSLCLWRHCVLRRHCVLSRLAPDAFYRVVFRFRLSAPMLRAHKTEVDVALHAYIIWPMVRLARPVSRRISRRPKIFFGLAAIDFAKPPAAGRRLSRDHRPESHLGLRSRLDLAPKRLESRLSHHLKSPDLKFS